MKDLNHPFIRDSAEEADVCRCGDIEAVHRPRTLRRFWRLVLLYVHFGLYSKAVGRRPSRRRARWNGYAK